MVIPSEADTWYRLKIEVEGDQITAFVDDLRVFAPEMGYLPLE